MLKLGCTESLRLITIKNPIFVKSIVKNVKKLNHQWLCLTGKCNCHEIEVDSTDLGNRIIQEMWNKEVRYINSKNNKDERK